MKNQLLILDRQNESQVTSESKEVMLPAKLKEKYPVNLLNLVQRGMNNPIREIEHQEEYVSIAVQKLAQQYGAREKIEDHVLSECVGIVIGKFGALSIDELSEAFRMCSIGSFGAVDMVSWGGVFNAGIIGRVLGAYRAFRRTVSKDIINSGQLEIGLGNSGLQKRFDEGFLDLLKEGKKKYLDWRSTPEYFHRACKRMGLFGLVVEEKELLYWEAVDLARECLRAEIGDMNKKWDRRGLYDELFLLERGVMTKTVGWAYRKLIVFVKVLNVD